MLQVLKVSIYSKTLRIHGLTVCRYVKCYMQSLCQNLCSITKIQIWKKERKKSSNEPGFWWKLKRKKRMEEGKFFELAEFPISILFIHGNLWS